MASNNKSTPKKPNQGNGKPVVSNSNWQADTVELIKKNRQITDFNGTEERQSLSESANYEVNLFVPSIKLDGEKEYFISGRDYQIMLQASLLKAAHDILGNRLGYTIDFENWFIDFSYEFKAKVMNQQAIQLPDLAWGKPVAQRPKFEFVSYDDQLFLKHDYHKIKFWENRDNKDKFIYITGTLSEIRQQLISLMRGGTAEDNEIGKQQISESRLLSGWPEIKIKFWQVNKVEGSKVRYDTELSISLIGYGEAIEDNQPKTLDLADLKLFKSRIEQLFYPNGQPFILERGLETYTYQDWKKGYASFTHFKTQQNAIDLYQKLVQIKGDSFNPDAINCGKPYNPAKYKTQTEKTVLNNRETIRNFRPLIDLQFWQAWVFLPQSQQKIMLVNRSSRGGVDPRLL